MSSRLDSISNLTVQYRDSHQLTVVRGAFDKVRVGSETLEYSRQAGTNMVAIHWTIPRCAAVELTGGHQFQELGFGISETTMILPYRNPDRSV